MHFKIIIMIKASIKKQNITCDKKMQSYPAYKKLKLFIDHRAGSTREDPKNIGSSRVESVLCRGSHVMLKDTTQCLR